MQAPRSLSQPPQPQPYQPARLPVRPGWKTLAALAGLPLCLLAAGLCLNRVDSLKPKDWQKDQLTYLPSGKILKPMTLGYTEVAASLLWVKGVLYFADAYLSHGNYRWMGHILKIVTTLNPRFKEAYAFGASVLTKNAEEIPATLELLERGLKVYPGEWQWRVSAALARQKLDSNLVAAADWLKPVVTDTAVPRHILGLLTRFLQHGGSQLALEFLLHNYGLATTPMQREIIEERLAHLNLNVDSTHRNAEIARRKKFIAPALQRLRAYPAEVRQVSIFLQKILMPDTPRNPEATPPSHFAESIRKMQSASGDSPSNIPPTFPRNP